MKKSFLFIILLFVVFQNGNARSKDLAQYVDPYIGTGDHGHVFLGAHVPFGAVQVGPNNYVKGWDWCSGYHYSDSIVTGFSQMHLSGTGIGDLGDILMMPYTGKLMTSPGTVKAPLSGWATTYTHKDEVVKPGYYSVNLKAYSIKAELTATERVALHKYTFPQSSSAHISINLAMGIGWDRPVKTFIKKVDATTYTGYRYSTGWSVDQRLYFAIKLSRAADATELFNGKKPQKGIELDGDSAVAVLSFKTKAKEVIMVKVGVSPVSESNALANITAEIPAWNFQQVADNAYAKWNKELGRVSVESKDIHQLRIFYTALYHLFTAPVLFNDHNGDYRGTDKKEYKNPGFQNYTVFSLWDVYRAAQPLYTIIQPDRVPDMVQSLLAIYKQQGKLPIWPLMGSETDCMVGYPAVPVIADAYFKGFKGIDPELVFEAMKASSMRDDYGVNHLKTRGYIPADKEKESVSKALEYALSDWAIAQLAQKLGKQSDYEYYSKRAKAYTQYFDPKTGFMRPKLDNGSFREPLDPFKSIHEWGDYTEGNAWQYTWLVPQDVEGLVSLFGGEKPFVRKLDSLFVVQGGLGAEASPDISGLIGQYAHGNEPSHHIAYLYSYIGQQWKTAEKIRYILENRYFDNPAGLSGNEDCGQMSAWYILSSLGFYQVNPAGACFVFGSPSFD
ncbi:MAG: alpha-1,2-mannosidase, partial [Bacteroidetes bacterium]|nr:alpha-1,2-mannosidase [Bacteroidota bacterium]